MALLRAVPWFLKEIAEIYLEEWGWHFRDEWGVNDKTEMMEDLKDNFMDATLVLYDDITLVGTVALLPDDLKSHMHLGPWVTCLYVKEAWRCKGLGKMLVESVASGKTTYLWCYTLKEMTRYKKWGYELVETVIYGGEDAFVMKR